MPSLATCARPLRAHLLVIPLLLLGGCLDDQTTAGGARHTPAPPAAPTAIAPDYWPTEGWQPASADAQGFLPGAFDTLAADAASALPYHTSLLVIRNGWLLHESYNGLNDDTGAPNDADSLHHVWSISKSVTSLTVGRALTRGDLQWPQLEATVGDSFSAAATNGLAAGDPRLGIRMLDALRMRSGLGWNEPEHLLRITTDPFFRTALGMEPNCPAGPDQLLCGVLQLPSAYAPGTVWNYNTYDTYLVSGFFTRLLAAGAPQRLLADYADAQLFAPMGVDAAQTDWRVLTADYSYGGGLLHITSRALAKVGLLALYGGKWGEQQLIDPEWMALSLQAQGNGKVASFDGSGNPAGSTTRDIPYGLQWWRVTGPGLDGLPSISARGLGGQMLHIFPDKELVILITCDDNFTDDRSAAVNTFLQDRILAALAP